MSPVPSAKRSLTIAFFTIFLDLLGFGLIIPIQPFYAESFNASPTMVTLLGASYSFMQFMFAPVWGRLSDRWGRRPIVLFSIFVSILGHAAFGLAGSLGMLFAARMLVGFGNANIGTAQAIISDVTTPATRAKGMGLIGAAFGLGFIFGPAVGGILGEISPAAPAFAAAGLGVVNLALAATLLPETRRAHEGGGHRGFMALASLKESARQLNVGAVLTVTLLVTFGFAMMEQICGLFIQYAWLGDSVLSAAEQAKAATRLTSYYLVAVGVTATVIQGGLIGRLQKRFGEVRLARGGVLLLVVSMTALPAMVGSRAMAPFLLSACLLAAGSGLTNPSLTSLLSRSVAGDAQGGTLGANQSMAALGRVLGPATAGLLFEATPSLPFYVAAGLIAVGLLATMRLRMPGASA
jgi:MFS family permease